MVVMVILRRSASKKDNPNYREFKPKGDNREASNNKIFEQTLKLVQRNWLSQ